MLIHAQLGLLASCCIYKQGVAHLVQAHCYVLFGCSIYGITYQFITVIIICLNKLDGKFIFIFGQLTWLHRNILSLFLLFQSSFIYLSNKCLNIRLAQCALPISQCTHTHLGLQRLQSLSMHLKQHLTSAFLVH